MPLPFLEIAGLGASLIGSMQQAKEARRRFNAMRRAAQMLQQRQDAEFATARNELRGAQAAYESDPARLSLRQQWEERLKNPTILDPAQISLMKAQGMDRAGANASGQITALREQAQRAGLRGSPLAVGAEASLRSRSFGRNQAISNDLDLGAAKANREYEDSLRRGYADFTFSDLDRRSSFAQQLAQMLGSRQYGESALLAAM